MSMQRNLMIAKESPQKTKYWLDANRTDGLAESDRAAIAVFKAAGLCNNDEYMTEDEASAVVTLPSFMRRTALVNWDWSKLINLNGELKANHFYGCDKLNFTYLPNNLANNTTTLSNVFQACTSLSITSLPEWFGSQATNLYLTFAYCSNLAISSLPEGFGSRATNLQQTFLQCGKITLTSLPSNFGNEATNMLQTFVFCGKIGNANRTFNLNNNNFGRKCKNFFNIFLGTPILNFEGAFDFSSIDTDSVDRYSVKGFNSFVPQSTKSIRFVKNTLKYSSYNSETFLTNIDTDSLLSFAECLYDFGEFQEDKIWKVTAQQKALLDSTEYEPGVTYTQYIERKGWRLTV